MIEAWPKGGRGQSKLFSNPRRNYRTRRRLEKPRSVKQKKTRRDTKRGGKGSKALHLGEGEHLDRQKEKGVRVGGFPATSSGRGPRWRIGKSKRIEKMGNGGKDREGRHHPNRPKPRRAVKGEGGFQFGFWGESACKSTVRPTVRRFLEGKFSTTSGRRQGQKGKNGGKKVKHQTQLRVTQHAPTKSQRPKGL